MVRQVRLTFKHRRGEKYLEIHCQVGRGLVARGDEINPQLCDGVHGSSAKTWGETHMINIMLGLYETETV